MMFLLKVIYIYSVFQEPIGQPIYMIDEYPNQQICEYHLVNYLSSFPQQLNMDYTAYAEATCITPDEFFQMIGQGESMPESE